MYALKYIFSLTVTVKSSQDSLNFPEDELTHNSSIVLALTAHHNYWSLVT